MTTLLVSSPRSRRGLLSGEVPPLENGAHLTASEFMRRYEVAHDVKKAQLIQGIVCMASPVRIDQHGEQHQIVNGWLFNYSLATPGTRGAIDSTTRLGPDDVPQPDALLRILPEHGGRTRVNAKGYLEGPPELVVEVAASTASNDVREKLESYRRAGVREYLVWRTEDQDVNWWQLVDDDYVEIAPDEDGIIRSQAFPGLWLHVDALLDKDATQLIATLQKGLASSEHADFIKTLSGAKILP